MPQLRIRGRVLDLDGAARVMGIVNVTPDSFYERVGSVDAALASARSIVADGAALIDLGGQSYAAGNGDVAAEEERRRVVPVVEAIAGAQLDAVLSIDTYTASVARAALDAGAHLINDCSGLSDPALAATVAEFDAGLVIMHLKGRLKVREPDAYVYGDVIAEIIAFLHQRIERAVAEGVRRDAIVVDPGLEFGKEPATDLEILRRFGELAALGYPVLLAASRKSFLGRIVGRPAAELLPASLAAASIGIAAGARLVRTHDVAETVQLAQLMAAVAGNSAAQVAV
jgi:dihydropteroate synthase